MARRCVLALHAGALDATDFASEIGAAGRREPRPVPQWVAADRTSSSAGAAVPLPVAAAMGQARVGTAAQMSLANYTPLPLEYAYRARQKR